MTTCSYSIKLHMGMLELLMPTRHLYSIGMGDQISILNNQMSACLYIGILGR